MKFSEETFKKYYKGNGIKPYKGKVTIEPINPKAVDRINKRVLESIRSDAMYFDSNVEKADKILKKHSNSK